MGKSKQFILSSLTENVIKVDILTTYFDFNENSFFPSGKLSFYNLFQTAQLIIWNIQLLTWHLPDQKTNLGFSFF